MDKDPGWRAGVLSFVRSRCHPEVTKDLSGNDACVGRRAATHHENRLRPRLPGLPQLQRDALGLEEALEPFLAQLTANAALLVASERHRRYTQRARCVVGVDPDGAR